MLELEPQMARPFIVVIEDFVISEDVTFHDESGHWGLLALQGPRAAALLALALGQEVPSLPMYASTTCQLAGHTVCCMRRSHTGELGYQLLAPPAALPDVWNALWVHREACEARAVGLEMLDTVRIEAGIPVYGRDMTRRRYLSKPISRPLSAIPKAAILDRKSSPGSRHAATSIANWRGCS